MNLPTQETFSQKQDSAFWTILYGLFFFGTFQTLYFFQHQLLFKLSEAIPNPDLFAEYMLSYYGIEHPFAFMFVAIKLLSAISLTLIFMATYKSLLNFWKSQREALSPEQVKWQIEDLKTQIALLRDENQQLKAYTETLKASLEKIN
jgi:hypothetical protein